MALLGSGLTLLVLVGSIRESLGGSFGVSSLSRTSIDLLVGLRGVDKSKDCRGGSGGVKEVRAKEECRVGTGGVASKYVEFLGEEVVLTGGVGGSNWLFV